MLALVDCNNFFVSCEKVFNPKLEGKPVVVLSSNDGCIVSRSPEAKALGIPMGAPAFEYKELFKKYGVILFSSNFAFYLDMSRRVMQILQEYTSLLEIYSIDEAFLSFTDVSKGALEPLAKEVREKVLKWTGIPVSIGIAPTKTLAKVATHFAKKSGGVLVLDEINRQCYLEALPIEEIWGIGRRLVERLRKKQLYTAWQLVMRDDAWIKKELTVVGLKMVWELRGIACIELDEFANSKKSISTAKSFDRLLYEKEEVLAILADYTAYVAEKLRAQGSLASSLTVWLHGPEYSQEASIVLVEPTDYTPTLMMTSKKLLEKIFKEGFGYKRVGVLLGNFVSNESYALDLFVRTPSQRHEKETKVMQLLDAANEKWGKKTLYYASQDPRRVKKQFSSPRYTTSWDELFLIFL